MNIKLIMRMIGPDGLGWSEAHSIAAFSSLGDSGLSVQSLVLMQRRAYLLGAGCTMLPGELRALDGTRRSTFVDPPAYGNPAEKLYNTLYNTLPLASPTGINGEADFANTTLLVKKGTAGGSGNLFISGIPDYFTEEDQTPDVLNPWAGFWGQYESALLAAPIGTGPGWGIFQNDRSGGNPPRNIIGYAGGVITTDFPLGVAPGDKVQISGMKPASGAPHGVLRVSAVAGATLTLLGLTGAGYTYIRGGQVRKFLPQVFPYTSLTVVRITGHKRGNSLDRRRGRLKTRLPAR